MILTKRKIAIIESSSPNNLVVLSAINDGVDGSVVFGFTNEHEGLTIEGGQSFQNTATPLVDVRVLKPSTTDEAQLNSWVNNNTDVYVSILTLNGFILIGDASTNIGLCKIVANEKLSGTDVYAFKISKKTTVGFDDNNGSYQGGMSIGKNAFSAYNWGDSDSSNVADGWSVTAGTTTSFSSGSQNIEFTDSTINYTKNIYLPFNGESVTFSLNVDSITDAVNIDTLELAVFPIDANDSTIGTEFTQSFSTSGRKSLLFTIPENTVRINCRIRGSATSGNTFNISISNPALRIDGESTYTKF